MSWYHDRIDWLGGYPYEFASVDEIVYFFGKDNFLCKKIKSVNGIGCNEYLFINKKNSL
jgi:2-polyprenyl-6-hydroxyphenyl methylase/3-demethylubiquinone-9 3-methyltransferase